MIQLPLPFSPANDFSAQLPLTTIELSGAFADNLTRGQPIPTKIEKWNSGYGPTAVLSILQSLLSEAQSSSRMSFYTNPVFLTNLSSYLHVYGDGIENARLTNASPQFEFVNPLGQINFDDFAAECIFTHGRFNGVPHPGYLHSIVRAKAMEPELPVTLAIETDEYSVRMGQAPFLDVLLRASLLWYTGLIDRLVIIASPFYADNDYDEAAGEINWYWEYMYAVDTGFINPRLLISYGEEDYARKCFRAPMRANITTINVKPGIGKEPIHMSNIRNGTMDQDDLLRSWQWLAMYHAATEITI